MPPPDQRPAFSYDIRARQYRSNVNGRFVPAARVAAAVDAVALGARAEASRLGARLVAGQSSIAEFQTAMIGLIKAEHVAAAIAGKGGVAMMSAADFGYVGSLVKKQYQFLRDFAADIASGAQPLDKTLSARAGLYGDALAPTHRAMERRVATLAGAQEEKSLLGPADHCDGAGSCIEQARLGWRPIGTLIPCGARRCLARCKCRLAFRNAPIDQGVAA